MGWEAGSSSNLVPHLISPERTLPACVRVGCAGGGFPGLVRAGIQGREGGSTAGNNSRVRGAGSKRGQGG